MPSTANLADEVVVFNSLLGGIFQRVFQRDPANLEDLRQHLLGELRDTNEIRLPTTQQLQILLQDTSSMLAPNFTQKIAEDEMAEILHWVYLWSCDSLGPVSADRMISEAVSQTEALPQGRRFSPRSLL